MNNGDKRATILIVDDADIIRYSLKNFFQEYDFEVVTCTDGMEGIKMAAECKPVVIFLDLLMPNLDGIKMLQIIKMMDELKNIPVIVISGNTNKTNVVAAVEAGADKVISKPLQKDIIVKTIAELLGNDFLVKKKKQEVFTETDNQEIIKQLRRYFVNGFQLKKNVIKESLLHRDRELLKTVVHDIRGTGAMIGYPELTTLCEDAEERLSNPKVDWTYIKAKCEQIISIVKSIEY
jgi:CheY-like chemotaxis protein